MYMTYNMYNMSAWKTVFIIGFIFVVMIEAKYKRRPYKSRSCDDVAIIGAGIAGTYAGWRLRKLNKQITVYEYSNRVGGRCYTMKFPDIPDINVELGAMRFTASSHKLLSDTIRELGLPVQKFVLGGGASADTTVHVRGTHLRYKDLGGTSTPYNLLPNEQKPVSQLKWEMFKNYTDVLSTTFPEDDQQFQIKDVDGLQMYKQSINSLYHKFLSSEAQSYIRDTSSFLDLGVSASAEVLTSPPSQEEDEVSTVTTGFGSIPEMLLETFLRASQKHDIRLNHHLKAIKKMRNGNYNLYFEPTITINGRTSIIKIKPLMKKCAKKVILAVNRLSLESLNWKGLHQPHIREYITKAVKDVSAGKFFLAYNSPWWRRSPVYSNYAISDTPLKQTYDFGTSKATPTKSLLLPMYNDGNIPYWNELIEREHGNINNSDAVFSVGKEIVKVTNKYLSAIYRLPLTDIPPPINGIISYWHNYPYGGAWQLWMPGYIWPEVERQMTKPSKKDDVFVAVNAFSSRSLSYDSNSALQVVELVMPYFGLKSKG
ncbi:aplysianin-A-like [Mytilus edulis]|uniref:aplysianin-A-like n=1 Tax=Mytilus edulis TaxID=6550 RepID=UPI0039F08E02